MGVRLGCNAGDKVHPSRGTDVGLPRPWWASGTMGHSGTPRSLRRWKHCFCLCGEAFVGDA